MRRANEDQQIAPVGEYHRTLRGADFSLEGRAQGASRESHFYLLKEGQVLLDTGDFTEALQAYRGLCREFWHDRLHSENPEERIACAWGLLGLEPEDREAAAVIKQDGDDAARKRLEQIRRRAHAQNRPGRRWTAG